MVVLVSVGGWVLVTIMQNIGFLKEPGTSMHNPATADFMSGLQDQGTKPMGCERRWDCRG